MIGKENPIIIVRNAITIIAETKCPKFRIFLTPHIHLNSRIFILFERKISKVTCLRER